MDPLEIFAGTPIFGGLREGELERLRPSVRSRSFEKGSYLFREGDSGSHLYVIVRGKVKIGRVEEGGAEVVFAIAGADDLLGELSVSENDGERTADAQALEPTVCLTIARAPRLEFLSTQPSMLLQIISTLSGYIRRKDAAIAEMHFSTYLLEWR